MRIVAHVAAETAMLLGTPAQVEGNLIRVSTGLVGVNEACSGIRSLQTSLMIGLLFGELKRLSVLRRVALVAGAVAIALFANFFRAVFLVQVAATESISEVEPLARHRRLHHHRSCFRRHDGTRVSCLAQGENQQIAVAAERAASRSRARQSLRILSQSVEQIAAGTAASTVPVSLPRCGSLLALVCRDRDCCMVSRPRNQSCQRHTLERAMARTGAEFSQTEDRPRNSRCPPFRRGRGSGMDANVVCQLPKMLRVAKARGTRQVPARK